MQKAIFLDRDGVINVDKGYVYRKEDFEFAPKVFEALKYFQSKGYILIIITNQSGIARGYYLEEEMQSLHSYMQDEFRKNNIEIKKIYFCPHSPLENCLCRKPNPKMLLDAKLEFNIDMKNSWVIGDKESDVQAGFNAGVTNLILIGKKYDKSVAKFNVNSLGDTIDLIF